MKLARRKNAAGWLAVAAAAAIAVSPLAPAGHAAAAQSPYKIIEQAIDVDGTKSNLSALNTDNTTYVAIRSLNDSIGLNTDWNRENKTVTVTGRDRELVLSLEDGSATLNEQRIYGLPAIVQNDTTYVPFRFLLERMGYGVAYDSSTKTIGIETIRENELRLVTEKIEETGEKKRILIHYPRLTGFADEAVQKKINETLKNDAELNAEIARESLDDSVGEIDSSSESVFEGTYTITYNEQNKLSLYVDYYIYTGGAHGSVARATYTFDLATGNLLKLKDAAGGNENYVRIINAEIQSQIKARKIPLIVPFQTIEPDRDFFLKHNGVVVYFGQYEYAPYAAGMPEFEIPFSAFK